MLKVGVPERLRYWFDNSMSRGTPALIGWLGLASLMLVGFVSGTVWLAARDDAKEGPRALIWDSMLRTLDPGTMGEDEGSPLFLTMMLTATIGGILIVSALVGVLVAGLNAKLAELRKGRSVVVEHGHTVVLGWSDQIFTVVAELAKAHGHERSRVVVLADRDKVEMEDELRRLLPKLGRLRVVCRTGDPTRPADLEIVRLDRAGVIVIPAPAGDDPDIHLIKTLLALHHRTWTEPRPPTVAVVTDSTNLAAARLAAGSGVELIDAEDITARLVVQSRRQPGLSLVCDELLTFDGDEIYMRSEPSLTGATFHQAVFAFATASPFGLRRADGTVMVNPPGDTVLRADDELIVLAPEASAIRLAELRPAIVEAAISTAIRHVQPAERTLMLGWNERATTILTLLDQYLPAGSTVDIAARTADADAVGKLNLEHLTTSVVCCDPTDRSELEELEPARYQYVIVIANGDLSPQHADSHTMVTLLHLRDIKERRNGTFSIVSELLDDDNRRLAQVTRADDFVVGNKLISLLLTQLSENQHLVHIFTELFDAQGSDMYLEPADNYLIPGMEANFATVVEAACRRGETAVGYRLNGEAQRPPAYGVVLNPDKSAPLRLGPQDQVVVLAHISSVTGSGADGT